jgi:hypothetical protein
MIEKIISGGQTGADLGGLVAAKKLGIPTGGTSPPNWITENGPNFDLKRVYGLKEYVLEHNYPESAFPMRESTRILKGYVDRTAINVEDSDGTIRIAQVWGSPGEKCTMNAIKKYNKPYLDIDCHDLSAAKDLANWIKENKIKTLNVAGNRESKAPGIEEFTVSLLTETFKFL